MNPLITVIPIFIILLLMPMMDNVEGFLSKAGKLEIHLLPGESKTVTWSLYTERDTPTEIALRGEGDGVELLSFPTIIAEPDTWYDIEITVTVPENHANDVYFEPSIYAMLVEPAVGEGGVAIKIQLKNAVQIFIGDPIIEETVVEEKPLEESMEEKPLEESMEEKQEETPQEVEGGLTIQSPEEQEEGGGCLIATAAYGSEMAQQVQLLREIRDDKLLSTASGSSFMSGFNTLYYSFSPAIADLERENPIFREVVKITLTPLITSLSILNYVDMDSEAEVLGYGISLILLNIGMYFVAPAILITKLRR